MFDNRAGVNEIDAPILKWQIESVSAHELYSGMVSSKNEASSIPTAVTFVLWEYHDSK